MSDTKSLMRMDKLDLITLLERLTEENNALRTRAAAVEEANARLVLSAREAEARQHSLEQQLTDAQEHLRALEEASAAPASTVDEPQPYQPQTPAYGASQQPWTVDGPASQCSLSDEDCPPALPDEAPAAEMVLSQHLPVGSFAEAMVQVQQIVERTQRAADEYLNRCQAEYDQRKERAEEILQQAQQQADELLQDAQSRRRTLDEQEMQVRSRLREEVTRLNQFVQALDGPEGAPSAGRQE